MFSLLTPGPETNIYHFGCKWGLDLLLYKVIPVDGGEEAVCSDLILKM